MSRFIRELLEALVLAGLVFLMINISIRNFQVQGQSMEPTLNGGEYLIVNKISYFRIDLQRLARLVPFWDVDTREERYLPFTHPPERGDVIVFHAPRRAGMDRDFVKRVIGLPGERVEIRDGKVYINDEEFSDPYLKGSDLSGDMDCVLSTGLNDCLLGEDEYFVLGDNRDRSSDSRSWGPVPLSNVIGKVWFIYWPPSKLPFIETRVSD